MSYTGRINVDALIHDSADGSLRVIDVESSKQVATLSAVVNGVATANGTVVDLSSTGYRDAAGDAVSFSSVSTLVLKGTSALTLEADDVLLKTAAGQCGVTATPGLVGNVTVYGSGSFSLVLCGE